jgi:hypothetical protein
MSTEADYPYWTKMVGGKNYRLHVSKDMFFADKNKFIAHQEASIYYSVPPLPKIEDRGEVDESHGE